MERLDNITNIIPFTGKRKVNIPVTLSNAEWIKGYFNGSDMFDRVTGLTIGKEYVINEVIGFGDVFDVTVIDDNMKSQTLGSFFFEDVS